jgi:hypothetical protein
MFVLRSKHDRELAIAHHIATVACQQRDTAQAKLDRIMEPLRRANAARKMKATSPAG